MTFVRLIIALPCLLLLVLFALSNPEPVQLALWPTDLSLQSPLSVAVLVASALFFLLGGLVVSLGSFGQRRRARLAERRVRALEDEMRTMPQRSNASAVATIDG